MRILVVGATGTIGKEVVAALSGEHEVVSASRKSSEVEVDIADGGSFTLTSGVLSRQPMNGSGAVSLVNAGLEGFTRAAANEAARGIRVNIVSPPWVTETLIAYGMDPSIGLPAATVARSYVEAVTGTMTGQVIEPR